MKRNRRAVLFSLPVIVLLALVLLAGAQQCRNSSRSEDHRLLSVLWHVHSAEYRALAYQAFNTARMVLDQDGDKGGRRAIIVDIDDTVINTARYQAYLVKNNAYFPNGWDDWCAGRTSTAVPGSREFLAYASKKGYTIFYISNRSSALLDATIADMKRLGFPQCSSSQVLLKSGDSSKKNRRDGVMARYSVRLLIGDNIEDFSELFESKTNIQRKELADSMSRDFGSRFIVLPNTVYGSWLYRVLQDSGRSVTGGVPAVEDL